MTRSQRRHLAEGLFGAAATLTTVHVALRMTTWDPFLFPGPNAIILSNTLAVAHYVTTSLLLAGVLCRTRAAPLCAVLACALTIFLAVATSQLETIAHNNAWFHLGRHACWLSTLFATVAFLMADRKEPRGWPGWRLAGAPPFLSLGCGAALYFLCAKHDFSLISLEAFTILVLPTTFLFYIALGFRGRHQTSIRAAAILVALLPVTVAALR